MKVEIQLRTIAMDSWASLEHQLRYKRDVCVTEKMEKTLARCADMSSELDRQMSELYRTTYEGFDMFADNARK